MDVYDEVDRRENDAGEWAPPPSVNKKGWLGWGLL